MTTRDEIKRIREWNRKVELDKAWETNWTRRLFIALLTYSVIVIFFYSAGLPKPWIHSIVPAVAFLLSTLMLPVLKRLWSRSRG